MKYQLFIILSLVVIPVNVSAQNKYFSLGTKYAGISFGNPKIYNGVKLNLFDKEVKSMNGVSISINNLADIKNGLSVGFLNFDSIQNGVSLSFASSSLNRLNGVAIGLASVRAKSKINGVALSGFDLAADTLNGFFAGFIVSSKLRKNMIKQVNGVSMGILVGANCENLNGLSIGAINFATTCNGVVIGLFNKAKRLRGIQLGLWNVAENKKRFKRMPFLNFNFNKI